MLAAAYFVIVGRRHPGREEYVEIWDDEEDEVGVHGEEDRSDDEENSSDDEVSSDAPGGKPPDTKDDSGQEGDDASEVRST